MYCMLGLSKSVIGKIKQKMIRKKATQCFQTKRSDTEPVKPVIIRGRVMEEMRDRDDREQRAFTIKHAYAYNMHTYTQTQRKCRGGAGGSAECEITEIGRSREENKVKNEK